MIRKRKIINVLLITVLLLMLSGCWSRDELNELSLGMGMAVDKLEDGYKLSVQVAISNEIAGQTITDRSPTVMYSIDGKTVCDAFRRLTYEMARAPYLAHMLVLIMSEDVAKEGIIPTIDCLLRDNEFRLSTNIYIAKDIKASDVLKVQTHLERITSNKLKMLTENAENFYSSVKAIPLIDLVNTLTSDGSQAVITGITVLGDIKEGTDDENTRKVDTPTRLKLTSYAVFKKDQLVGWLDEETSQGVNLIKGDVKSTVISIPCDTNKFISIQTTKTKTDITAKLKDGKPVFTIKHQMEGELCGLDCDIDLANLEQSDEIKQAYIEELTKIIQTTVDTIQSDYQLDILGFGDIMHRKEPKYWKKNSQDWNNLFKEAEVKIKVDVNFTRPGSVSNSLQSDVK
jgi:spore germination protein KC